MKLNYDFGKFFTEKADNFKALVARCYPTDFDEANVLDLASIYEHEVTKEMTLNPGADLATIVSNCDSAVKTIVLQEGAKWSPQSQVK